MKKVIFLAYSCVLANCLMAQEPLDALRYSWIAPGGTARQQAIGGAMGSLGGDISATFVNPAGLAFYRTGDVVISPLYRFGQNKATYLNRTETENNSKLNLGTSGVVFGSNGAGRKIKNATFSIAINRTADFNTNLVYRGQNNQSSYSQRFLEEIRNNNDKDANSVGYNYPLGTSLAFNTYWIDTVAGGASGNYQFQTRAPIGTGLLQQESIITRGGINEFAFAGAVNFNDKVMLGGTLSFPVLRYEREASFTEADATANPSNNFDFATLDETVTTKGVGVNLRAGLIFKPVESIRLGLAFMTPTAYSLTDDNFASVTTNTEGYKGELNQNSQNADLVTAGGPAEFQYTLITPYHLTGSVSYVFGATEDVTKQQGFITADLEYVNYKSASFQTSDESGNDQANSEYLKALNTAIDNAYKSAVNFRIGGELKFNTLMVRAGAGYFGNPYQNIHGEKGSRLNISGGLGYRNKGMFVDLTYVHSINKDVQFPYRLESAPYFGADVKSTLGNALMTIGFKF